MLKAITIDNYRSIERTRVELGPLTALVGGNGSGKSNVLDAVHLFADVMHLGLEGAITTRTGIGAIRRFQDTGHPYDVTLRAEVVTDAIEASYTFTLKGDRVEEYRVGRESARVSVRGGDVHEFEIEAGVWRSGPRDTRPQVGPTALALPLVAGDGRFRALGEELRRMAVYSIYPDALRHPQKYDPAKPMNRVGSNWVSVLKDQPRETWHADLVAALHRLTGDIRDVRVRPVGGFLTAQFLHAQSEEAKKKKRQKWFDAYQESDGTLRVAGILMALLQDPAPTLVGIEEPELTVHPGALPLLVDFMREAADRSQVVFTTHSPDILDHIDSDEVRVVYKQAGVTRVERLDERKRGAVARGLRTLGEVMRTEGLQTELPLES